jgi:Domain of unknown function (DUF4157)/Effector protein
VREKQPTKRSPAQPSLESPSLELPSLESRTVQGAGQPLSAEQRAAYEPLFSHDFGRVRVFADDRAASDQHALAFASGSDIVLGNRVNPSSEFGREVLMHELAHTVQYERFGKPIASTRGHSAPGVSTQGDVSELEAHRAARSVLMGQPANINSAPSASISRWPEFLGEAWDGAKQFAGGIGTVVDAVKHDGLKTFSDFSGSVKREQARDELSPGFQGSSAELETMAREIAEVRLGREDKKLGLDKDSTPESRQVQRDLALKGLKEEGAGSAGDIAAVTDRQRAQGELMQDRTLVGEDFEGPHSDGQITQTELRELARIYSGVRRGELDANIGSNPGTAPEERDLRRQQALEGLREEGLNGADDLSGVMDRQAAQNELLDKFDIVPDEFSGPRAPNAVSLEEFRHTARMFSDIRLGRGDLKIDGSELRNTANRNQMGLNEEMFKRATMNDLAAVLQTEAGREEISVLQNNVSHDPTTGAETHRNSTIKPLLDRNPGAANSRVADSDFGHTEERFYDESEGRPGKGVNTDVRYRPGEGFSMHPEVNEWEPFRSDVILFHELRHNVDSTRGRMNILGVDKKDAKVPLRDENGVPDPKIFSWDHDIVMDARAHARESEHEAIGLGKHADAGMTENDYRRERNAIGQLDSDSSLPGDASMAQRRRHSNPETTEFERDTIRMLQQQEQRRRNQRH